VDELLQRIDDERVANQEREQKKEDQQPPAHVAFPHQPDRQDNQHGHERHVGIKKGQEPVQKPVLQIQVDEAEQGDGERLQAFHRLVNHQGTHRISFQPSAPLQKAELDKEGDFHDLGLELLHQGGGGGGGAARGEEIINQDHAVAGLQGVDVDRDRIGP